MFSSAIEYLLVVLEPEEKIRKWVSLRVVSPDCFFFVISFQVKDTV